MTPDTERLLADYLAGALDAAGREELARRASADARIARELADFAQIDGQLRALAERGDAELLVRQLEARTSDDPALVEKILQRAGAPGGPGTRRIRTLRRSVAPPPSSALAWTVGLAATLLLALALGSAAGRPVPKPALSPSPVALRPEPAPLPPAPAPKPFVPPMPPLPKPPEPVAPAPRVAPPVEPPVAPPAAPAPKPLVPDVAPPPAPPRETLAMTSIATIHPPGEAFQVTKAGRVRIEAETPLRADEGVETGPAASAQIRFGDGTLVELGPESTLRSVQDRKGATRTGVGFLITIGSGRVTADVQKQPVGQALVFATPHAEATVLGTKLALHVTADATRLEVEEGRVRLQRLSDRVSAEVKTGQFAVAAAGVPLVAARPVKFLKGVNLSGRAVTVDGQRWMSHEQALADGLAFSAPPLLTTTTIAPRPAADAETSAMLNSAVFRRADDLGISWPLAKGTYDVHLWVMENMEDDSRAFEIRVEGRSVARDLGKGAKLGDWVKLGPIRTVVPDGVLHVDLVKRKADPHLMGIAVFEVQ